MAEARVVVDRARGRGRSKERRRRRRARCLGLIEVALGWPVNGGEGRRHRRHRHVLLVHRYVRWAWGMWGGKRSPWNRRREANVVDKRVGPSNVHRRVRHRLDGRRKKDGRRLLVPIHGESTTHDWRLCEPVTMRGHWRPEVRGLSVHDMKVMQVGGLGAVSRCVRKGGMVGVGGRVATEGALSFYTINRAPFVFSAAPSRSSPRVPSWPLRILAPRLPSLVRCGYKMATFGYCYCFRGMRSIKAIISLSEFKLSCAGFRVGYYRRPGGVRASARGGGEGGGVYAFVR